MKCAGGSATSMALGGQYGISCGSSTATVRRTGWTRQPDRAALCAVSSFSQHLSSTLHTLSHRIGKHTQTAGLLRGDSEQTK